MTTPERNYLTIFGSPERDAFVLEARARGPFFEKTSNAWIVADPELCRQLLTSPNLEPAPAVEHYRDVPAELGEPFSSVAFAFDHVPLSQTGDRHAQSRQITSIYLTGRREALHDWATTRLPQFLAGFDRPGRLDVLEDVLRPMVREFIETIANIDLPAHLDIDDVSLVFDKAINMRRRRQLEQNMTALKTHLRERLGPDATEDEVGMRLALVIVGKDATIGTFGEALSRVFRDHEGQPLSEMAFPRSPHQTAVPFVERVVMSDTPLAGQTLRAGERVRVVLQTFALGDPDQHHRLFGAGAHACLGRPASVDLWRSLSAHLSHLNKRVHLISYGLAKHSYVFNIPRQFDVEISP